MRPSQTGVILAGRADHITPMDLPFKTKLYAFAAAALFFAWPLLRAALAG